MESDMRTISEKASKLLNNRNWLKEKLGKFTIGQISEELEISRVTLHKAIKDSELVKGLDYHPPKRKPSTKQKSDPAIRKAKSRKNSKKYYGIYKEMGITHYIHGLREEQKDWF